jgi:hypothetical protein
MVVGTLICRTIGAVIGGRDALDCPDRVDALHGANVVGEAKLHGLGAISNRAAAYGDDEIGVGGMGLFGGSNDGLAGRVRWHRIERSYATGPKGFSNFFDLVALAVERAADHQKRAGSAQAVHLRNDRLGGGSSENHLVHGAENDTPLVHDDCPPRRFWFYYSLENNLAESMRGEEL